MAAIVTATCAACEKSVRLPSTAVRLLMAGGVTTCSYECPRCGEVSVCYPNPETLQQFANLGIVPEVYRAEFMPTISGVPPMGPPLTFDDLIQFGLEIEALS